jgi:hypothetical protein
MTTPGYRFTLVVRLTKNERSRYVTIPALSTDIPIILEKAMVSEVRKACEQGWKLTAIYGENYQFVGHPFVLYWEGDVTFWSPNDENT